MNNDYQESTVEFTDEDKSFIKSALRFSFFLIIVAPPAIYASITYIESFWKYVLLFFLIVAGGFGLIQSVNLFRDLVSGNKLVIKGTIIKKELWYSRPTKGKGSKSSSTYFFHFDDHKLKVEQDVFRKYEEGQRIEIHKGLYSDLWLRDELIT